jgi:hypothetical protein
MYFDRSRRERECRGEERVPWTEVEIWEREGSLAW